MFLTETTEFTERREKAKNVVGFFCEQKNTTTVLLCENGLYFLSMFSVNSSEFCERVRDMQWT